MYSNRPEFIEKIPPINHGAQISYNLIPAVNTNIIINRLDLFNNNPFIAASLSMNPLDNTNDSAPECVHMDKKQKR